MHLLHASAIRQTTSDNDVEVYRDSEHWLLSCHQSLGCRHITSSLAATSELRQLLSLSAEGVLELRLLQLPAHIDLALILDNLPRSECFTL